MSRYSLFPSTMVDTRVGCKRPVSKSDSIPLLYNNIEPRPNSHASDTEHFPAFDSAASKSFMDSLSDMSPSESHHHPTAASWNYRPTSDTTFATTPSSQFDHLYLSVQPSEESLVQSICSASRTLSVLLPECNLVNSYSQRPQHPPPEKPLPSTPLQSQHRRQRKQSNRSVTPSQLVQLSRAVSPECSIDWSASSTLQGSFSSTISDMTSLKSTVTTSPKSVMVAKKRQQRKNVSFRASTTSSDRNLPPMPLHLANRSLENDPAYISQEYSAVLPVHNLLPSPESSVFPSPTFPSSEACNGISAWEPDSDDETTSQALRKKISRKFAAERSARPRTASSATRRSSQADTPRRVLHRPSNDSDRSIATSIATTAAARESRSTTHTSMSQTTTLLRESMMRTSIEQANQMPSWSATAPSAITIKTKKKVKIGRRIKGWFSKASC